MRKVYIKEEGLMNRLQGMVRILAKLRVNLIVITFSWFILSEAFSESLAIIKAVVLDFPQAIVANQFLLQVWIHSFFQKLHCTSRSASLPLGQQFDPGNFGLGLGCGPSNHLGWF